MFTIALTNVLTTLFYIIPGFVLKKAGKAKSEHLSTMSAILVYVGTPFLQISAFLSMEYSTEFIINMGKCFVFSLFIQVSFMAILWAILHNRYSISKYRILTVGSVLGNVGFFGLPIVKALLPENPEVACYAAMTMLTMNVLIFTMGVFCITNDKKHISIKSALCNSGIIGFVIGFICYIFKLNQVLPEALINSVGVIGSMTTPLCMFIVGIRLASTGIKRIFTDKMAYIIALMKLLIFPLFAFAVTSFFPIDYALRLTLVVLMSTPCASMILGFAEMYHSETEISANCILVSTLMCFITIPLITLLL